MSDETWRVQVNRKIGQELVNVRGEDWITVKELMRQMINDSDEILAFFAAFEPPKLPESPTLPLEASKPAEATAPAPAPVRVPEPPSGAKGQELGPLTVQKVDVVEGIGKDKQDPVTKEIKPGKPYTRYIVTIGGVKASTFDSLLGMAAKNLLGKQCYFSASKGNFGYDLNSIRSAP